MNQAPGTQGLASTYPMARARPFQVAPELTRLQRYERPSRVTLWDGSRPWLITRHADVRRALADPRSAADPGLPGYPHVGPGGAAQQRRVKTFLDLDGPEHAAQRRSLIPNFTFRSSQALRPEIQRILDNRLDELLAGPKPADLVTDLALPFSTLVICRLLGVPYADHRFFQRSSDIVTSSRASAEEALAATEDLLAYLADLIDAKTAVPSGDVLSRLATEQVRTGSLSREQVAAMAFVLLVAGHETTANMIATGTALLLRHPQAFEAFRGGSPATVGNAVEELLRYLSIVQSGRRRVALADMRIGGRLIRRGEGLIIATDAANRDAAVFENPDVFDIRRDTGGHLAFGHGVHQCLGQTLARVELQVFFTTLARRVPGLALAVPLSRIAFKHDTVVYGVEHLPVTW
jgi:cytochrome P450